MYTTLIYSSFNFRKISHSPFCTWNLLRHYTNVKFCEAFKLNHVNHKCNKDKAKDIDQFQLTMDEHYTKLYDVKLANPVRTSNAQWHFEIYQTIKDMMPHIKFLDARDIDTKTLTLDLITPKKHLIKVLSTNHESILCSTAPMISKTTALELLQPPDLYINTALHNLQPVIFDTGASLAITGEIRFSSQYLSRGTFLEVGWHGRWSNN